MEEKEQNINEELQPEVEAPVNEESTAEETKEECCEEKEETQEETPAEPTLEEQIEDLKTQLLYKQAEFDNFRKRTLKEKAELILNGGERLSRPFSLFLTISNVLFSRRRRQKTSQP